jgi:transcriptional regulator with XRE-family HTH domain
MTVMVEGLAPKQPQELRSANTPLGRARVARGWSQDKAVRALVLLADNWGWEIASEPSLKVQLSRWEHGVCRPSETYRVLLCSLYRATPKELGFDRAPQTAKGLRERIGTLESLIENLTATLMAQGVQA